LVTCEHGGRRVSRTELDGSITIIADKYNGKKLNAPNDLAVASNGTIWFTDPGYGIKGDYEGLKEPFEQEKRNVFRVDPRSGDIKVVVDDFVMPSPRGRKIRRGSVCGGYFLGGVAPAITVIGMVLGRRQWPHIIVAIKLIGLGSSKAFAAMPPTRLALGRATGPGTRTEWGPFIQCGRAPRR
jgi:hypothetical protein